VGVPVDRRRPRLLEGQLLTNASEELQALCYQQLLDWTASEKILAFVFEAFDEPWKGSSDPLEPEKHWGLFTVDRKPKRVMRAHYDGLLD
jgi:hypothetical protein